MKICYVVYIWMFLTEIRVSLTDGTEMHGYSGKYVIISCLYMGASENVKYFCRDPCKNKKEDVLISSSRSHNGRFRLEDTRTGTFTVTITDLQESDSGIYWCGVDRTLIDSYYKIILRVSKDTTHPISTPAPQPESPFATSSRTSRYSNPDEITASSSVTELYQSNLWSVNIILHAVGGLILVIVLLCLLVAVYQYRKRVKTSASNKPSRHSERRAEEGDNDLQDTQNNKQIKSKKLKLEVPKSSESVYQNLLVNTDKSDGIYETMNSA